MVDDRTDVVADILDTLRLTTRIFGRFELTAPWGLELPETDYLTFYVMDRGSASLELHGRAVGPTSAALAPGDVVVLPHGSAHRIVDPSGGGQNVRHVTHALCPRPESPHVARFGGEGPLTSFVTGAFHFSTGRQGALLESLPALIHIPSAGAQSATPLATTVQLILAESAAGNLGASIISARLADILFLQVLRTRADGTQCQEHGFRALADPSIGASLRLMHGQIAHDWTVESLAHAVGMSRSAYSARFTETVGEPPLQYLSRWRMAKAAQYLRERPDSVSAIAERVGYQNAAAFMKAFTRTQGVSPAAYRKAQRAAAEA